MNKQACAPFRLRSFESHLPCGSDADYESYLPLPEAALRRRDERRQQVELMDLVRRVTEEQILRCGRACLSPVMPRVMPRAMPRVMPRGMPSTGPYTTAASYRLPQSHQPLVRMLKHADAQSTAQPTAALERFAAAAPLRPPAAARPTLALLEEVD